MQNYSSIEKEALAVLWSIVQFQEDTFANVDDFDVVSILQADEIRPERWVDP